MAENTVTVVSNIPSSKKTFFIEFVKNLGGTIVERNLEDDNDPNEHGAEGQVIEGTNPSDGKL